MNTSVRQHCGDDHQLRITERFAATGSLLSGIIITGLHFRCAPERIAESVPRQLHYTLDLPPHTNHFPIIVTGYR